MLFDWRRERRSLDREAFAARYDHAFLLFLDGPLNGDLQQHLSLITREITGIPEPGEPGSVVPLVNSGNNPYDSKILVGRARNCDVVIRHESVSKLHAEIRLDDTAAGTIVDRGSRNRTLVNDMELPEGESISIKSGDNLRFGGVFTVFLDPGALHDAIV